MRPSVLFELLLTFEIDFEVVSTEICFIFLGLSSLQKVNANKNIIIARCLIKVTYNEQVFAMAGQ